MQWPGPLNLEDYVGRYSMVDVDSTRQRSANSAIAQMRSEIYELWVWHVNTMGKARGTENQSEDMR